MTALMPHDFDAERAVLGTLLLSPAAMYAVRVEEGVSEADFYSQRNRLVWRAMAALEDADGAFDRVSVAAWLDHAGLLDKAGGAATLDELGAPIAAAGNVRRYAKDIRGFGLMRALLGASTEITAAVHDRTLPPSEIVDQYVGRLLDLADSGRSSGRMAGEAAQTVIEEASARTVYQEVTGIPSGFHVLDSKTGGFKSPRLYVFGARPKMGKSAFVTQIAGHAAGAGFRVAMFSLEMGDEEIAERMIGMASGVPPGRIERGGLTAGDTRKMLDAGQRIADLPLWLDDTANMSVDDIRARCRRIRRVLGGLDLVIVDYLQLMRHPKAPNMNNAVAATSRGLKLLAKDLGVAVIVLSQLNRDVEKRGASAEAKQPQPSDFRDSGAIEQDADLLGALWREDYYDPETDRKGMTDVAILAQRKGPTADWGEIVLPWEGRLMRFGAGEKPPPAYLSMS